MKTAASIVAVTAVVVAAPTAQSLCIYNGVDNAKTTIPQEFRDSKWVMRAKVVSAKDHFSDEEKSWTTYEIEVKHAYKGNPPKRLRFFTYRNSGGF